MTFWQLQFCPLLGEVVKPDPAAAALAQGGRSLLGCCRYHPARIDLC